MTPNDLSGLRPLRQEVQLTRRAHEEIRAAIVDGRLAAGSLTSVRALSDALGISRTPVREALVELAGDGMVAFERNRGVRIAATQRHDIEEIFQLRLWLEVPAVRAAVPACDAPAVARLGETLAAMRAHLDDELTFMRHDGAFHRTLLEATGNDRLAAFVAGLRDQTRTRGISTVGRSRPLAAILDEHEAIFALVAAGDADGAADAMARHLATTRALLLAQEASATPSQNPEDA